MHDDKTFAKNMIFTKKRALEHSSPSQLDSDYNMTIEPCDLMSPMYQTDHDAMMSIQKMVSTKRTGHAKSMFHRTGGF